MESYKPHESSAGQMHQGAQWQCSQSTETPATLLLSGPTMMTVLIRLTGPDHDDCA